MARRDSKVTLLVASENVPLLIQMVKDQFDISSIQIDSETSYPDKQIFLSYRRSDSEASCGRIYDRLAQAFGNDNVFRDVSSILPGYDFKPVLEKAVARCDIMLVIMGRQWANSQNRKRLHNDEDYVRFEIETALKRNIPVIPVWVGRCIAMPDLSDLPNTLHDLVRRQARQARPDPDFHTDMDKIISDIKAIFELSQPENR